MRLLAAGLNAHGQLSSTAGPTISTFTETARSAPGQLIEVCWAGWSDVVLRIGSRYFWRGLWGEVELQVMATQTGEKDDNRMKESPSLSSFFGTHDGCRGAVTSESKLFLFPEVSRLSEESVTCTATNLKCTHVAVNGVGRTAVALPLDPRSKSSSPLTSRITIQEFSNLDAFITFALHSSTSASPPPVPHTTHTLDSAPLHALHAGQTFHLLHTASTLSSWAADARHAASLGRPTSATTTPCTTPSAVCGFSSTDGGDGDGNGVAKAVTCANGHLAAALTPDGCVYVWGDGGAVQYPFDRRATEGKDADADEQSRLALFAAAEAEGWGPADGPLPVAIDALPDEELVDVAVGAAHLVLLDRTRGVWVAGRNDEAQLGNGFVGEVEEEEEEEEEEGGGGRTKRKKFFAEFERLDLGAAERAGRVRVTGVACAWYATFLLIEDEDDVTSG